MNKKIISILITALFIAPSVAGALDMPTSGNDMAAMNGVRAEAYVVMDAKTREVLISKNADVQWTPASLTKLVTALVVLDSKIKFSKVVTMTAADQVVGFCKQGGACVKSAPGVKFTVDGLFHAALMPSANNAANALARSTGLSAEDFAKKMNDKAKELGAISSIFYEPTGMDPANKITAGDYAKIAAAAFSNPYLVKTAGQTAYILRSGNNPKYTQAIKNTNKLLKDPDISVLAAKTGYLDESGYNFSSLVKVYGGDQLIVVVLGEQHLYSAFAETKQLSGMAQAARILTLSPPFGAVLSVISNKNY